MDRHRSAVAACQQLHAMVWTAVSGPDGVSAWCVERRRHACEQVRGNTARVALAKTAYGDAEKARIAAESALASANVSVDRALTAHRAATEELGQTARSATRLAARSVRLAGAAAVLLASRSKASKANRAAGRATRVAATARRALADAEQKVVGFGRGVTRNAANLAAGLSRAFAGKATPIEEERGLSEAAQRLTGQKAVIAERDFESIVDFAGTLIAKADEHVGGVPMPAPNTHACGGYQDGDPGFARRSGGQKRAVNGWERRDGLCRFRGEHVASLLLARREVRRAEDFSDTAKARLESQLDDALEMCCIWTGISPGPDAFAQLDRFDWLGRASAQGRLDEIIPDLDEIMDAHDRAMSALMSSDSPAAVRVRDARAWFAYLRSLSPGGKWCRDDSHRRAARQAGFGPVFGRSPERADTAAAAASGVAAVRQAARNLSARSNSDPTTARLTVFGNETAKLRVATQHEPSVVLLARGITQWLLARLRNVRTNRRMLRNEPVVLRGTPGAIGYSADLKKGTDPISVATATRIVGVLLEKTGAPKWMRDAAPWCTGRMTLQADLAGLASEFAGKPLTSGALMGLGPSWVVMSILNDWAARRSGGPESYQVNGDDLAALWEPSGCDRYERRIERACLVPNRDKSFRGPGVVFCEAFGEVRPAASGRGVVVRIVPSLRLGEASGVKSFEGDRGHSTADRLRAFAAGAVPNGFGRTHRRVSALARQTQRRVSLRRDGREPGRISEGGSGWGLANARTATVFLMGGRTSVATVRKTADESLRAKALRAEASALPSSTAPRSEPSAHTTTVAEATLARATAAAADAEIDGAWVARCKAPSVTKRHHQDRLSCRWKLASAENPFSLLKQADALHRWDARQRAIAHRHFKAGRWGPGLAYLATHSRRVEDISPPSLRSYNCQLQRSHNTWAQRRLDNI